MRHDIVAEGPAFRLRPVNEDDAAFIVGLRTDPRVNQFIQATSPSLADQQQWIRTYQERAGDYYFIIESVRHGTPEGTVGIYFVDTKEQCAEWGRWVLNHDSLAAIESAWLMYRVAFDRINLQMVHCRTMVKNQKVVSFHDSVGCARYALLPRFVTLNGRQEDVVEHRVTRADWARLGPALEQRVDRLSQKLVRAGPEGNQ